MQLSIANAVFRFRACRRHYSIAKPEVLDSQIQQNKQQACEELSKLLSIKKIEDWYQYTTKDVQDSVKKLLKAEQTLPNQIQHIRPLQHLSSLSAFLRDVYSDHDWQEWRFKRVPSSFWLNKTNQRRFFDWFEQEKGIRDKEDWYKIKIGDLNECGATALMSHTYGNSIAAAVMAIYPDHQWQMWKFQRVSRSFWKLKSNQRQLFDHIARQLGYISEGQETTSQNLARWYMCEPKKIMALDGAPIIALHQGSVISALRYIYSEHEWQEWLFQNVRVPQSFWDSMTNRQRFCDWLAKERLGFDPHREPERWYNVTHDAFHKNHGGGLLMTHYRDSVQNAVMDVYPSHEWLEWKFEKAQDGWWANVENQKRFLEWFANKEKIVRMDQWCDVDQLEVQKSGGSTLLQMYGGSLGRCLKAIYPDHEWAAWRFRKTSSGTFVA